MERRRLWERPSESHSHIMEQAVGQFYTFGCPTDRPCPGEQGLSVDGLRNILDGQSCHGSLFCEGSAMAPLWELAEAS